MNPLVSEIATTRGTGHFWERVLGGPETAEEGCDGGSTRRGWSESTLLRGGDWSREEGATVGVPTETNFSKRNGNDSYTQKMSNNACE